MKKKDRGYLDPSDFSMMITSFVKGDFSEYHPEIFADTLMMPSNDQGLTIIKQFLSAMAWHLESDGKIGWETECGKTILQNLAHRLADENNYDFIFDVISNGIR